jgi:hypothetical protein
VTRLTLDKEIGAVHFDEHIGRRAGAAMEPIDVLRDDREHLAGAFERRDGIDARRSAARC